MIECDVRWSAVMGLGAALVLGGCAVEESVPPVVKPALAESPEPEVRKLEEKSVPVRKPGAITEVDLGRLIELRDAGAVLLVDVRSGIFYGMGHIPGAVNLPKKKFASSWAGRKADIDAAVAAGKVVVVYCANTECPDGYVVAKELSEMGYAVSIYKGGWEEWKMTGFE